MDQIVNRKRTQSSFESNESIDDQVEDFDSQSSSDEAIQNRPDKKMKLDTRRRCCCTITDSDDKNDRDDENEDENIHSITQQEAENVKKEDQQPLQHLSRLPEHIFEQVFLDIEADDDDMTEPNINISNVIGNDSVGYVFDYSYDKCEGSPATISCQGKGYAFKFCETDQLTTLDPAKQGQVVLENEWVALPFLIPREFDEKLLRQKAYARPFYVMLHHIEHHWKQFLDQYAEDNRKFDVTVGNQEELEEENDVDEEEEEREYEEEGSELEIRRVIWPELTKRDDRILAETTIQTAKSEEQMKKDTHGHVDQHGQSANAQNMDLFLYLGTCFDEGNSNVDAFSRLHWREGVGFRTFSFFLGQVASDSMTQRLELPAYSSLRE